MKAFLFCTAYVANQPDAMRRYEKYVSFYQERMQTLGVEKIILLDDGSQADWPPHISNMGFMDDKTFAPLTTDVNVFSFKEHLGRPTMNDFLGWWRSFIHCYEIAKAYGFKKIIHIESDFFILSDRLLAHLQGINDGWHTLWTHVDNWPESAIQVICEDCFDELELTFNKVKRLSYNNYFAAEVFLPYTVINKSFSGDRINGIPEGYTGTLDYIGNIPTETAPYVFAR